MNKIQQEVLNTLSETEWTVQKDLMQIIYKKYGRKYKERTLRTVIKECRLLYKESRLDLLIIKSNRGYKLSSNLMEILKFTDELIQTGESMAREGRELREAALKISGENRTKNHFKNENVHNNIVNNDFLEVVITLFSKLLEEVKKKEEKRDVEI